MKRLINASLALVLVSAIGFAATGSAFAAEDFDSEMERAPQAPQSYSTGSQSPGIYEGKRMEYIPRNMEGSSGGIVGVVTLVGDDMIKLVEADTGITHEIKVTDAQEKALTTGYIINAELRDGRLVSYQEMGIPQDVKEVVYTSEHLPDVNILEQPQGSRFQQQPQQPYRIEQPDPYGNFSQNRQQPGHNNPDVTTHCCEEGRHRNRAIAGRPSLDPASRCYKCA